MNDIREVPLRECWFGQKPAKDFYKSGDELVLLSPVFAEADAVGDDGPCRYLPGQFGRLLAYRQRVAANHKSVFDLRDTTDHEDRALELTLRATIDLLVPQYSTAKQESFKQRHAASKERHNWTRYAMGCRCAVCVRSHELFRDAVDSGVGRATKVCRGCKQRKPLSAFPVTTCRGEEKRRSRCQVCVRAYYRAYMRDRYRKRKAARQEAGP